MKFMSTFIIYGCEARGDGKSPYLTRLTIFGSKLFSIYYHKFHRSDADEHHDHPWDFITIILSKGYIEETPCKECTGKGYIVVDQASNGVDYAMQCPKCKGSQIQSKNVWPGMILYRPATWRHRVVLRQKDGKAVEARTLVIRGRDKREWGFFTDPDGVWQQWQEYFKQRGC